MLIPGQPDSDPETCSIVTATKRTGSRHPRRWTAAGPAAILIIAITLFLGRSDAGPDGSAGPAPSALTSSSPDGSSPSGSGPVAAAGAAEQEAAAASTSTATVTATVAGSATSVALTIGADAPPGNAHPLASPTAVTFNPNVMGPPVDERDPAIVAAAYLRARLTCDRFDDGPVACARAAARYTEPSFGAILIDQASTAQDWDRVRRDRLQVRLRIDDIAVRPSGNGWLITIVHTRTLSREDADDLTFHAVTTVTAEPADDDRWWVTGDGFVNVGWPHHVRFGWLHPWARLV